MCSQPFFFAPYGLILTVRRSDTIIDSCGLKKCLARSCTHPSLLDLRALVENSEWAVDLYASVLWVKLMLGEDAMRATLEVDT